MFIFCNYNMFDLHQQISIVDEQNDEVKIAAICSLEDLPENIIELCYKYNVNQIHLNGSPSYNLKIIEDIYKINATKYNENKKLEIKEL